MLETMLFASSLPAAVPVGQQAYTGNVSNNVTGTLLVPSNVRFISAVVIGAGARGTTSVGGKGGSLRWRNRIPVFPGETLTISLMTNGGYSRITRSDGTILLSAAGGSGVNSDSTTIDSSGLIGGGEGGTGVAPDNGNSLAGGGGGAGGYAGNGGNAAASTQATTRAQSGSGGGGGGGHRAAGGGTGLMGQGANGQGGLTSAGSPGSGGTGANCGGGGRGFTSAVNGGYGGARIIWGDGRMYPATNTQDMTE